MKVGIIAPISMLEKYCVTKTQYCLPGLILDSPAYRKFYQQKATDGRSVVIMDLKKPSWKREPEEWDVVWRALEMVNPSIVVLPSYTYDMKQTVTVASNYFHRLQRLGEFKIFPCLEGTSQEEVKKCKASLKDVNLGPSAGQVWYALPSYLLNVADHKGKTMMYIENHLNIGELDGCGDAIVVTSLPIRLGLEGRLLTDYRPSPPSLTFLETEDRFPKVTERNVRTLIDYYEVP